MLGRVALVPLGLRGERFGLGGAVECGIVVRTRKRQVDCALRLGPATVGSLLRDQQAADQADALLVGPDERRDQLTGVTELGLCLRVRASR